MPGPHDYRDSPADEEKFKFDNIVHAVTVTDHLHRLNHDGMVFHASGKVLAMVDAEVDDFLIVTPAAPEPHMQTFKISAGRGDIDIVAYEGVTTSADGTAVDSFNTHRDRTNVGATLLYSGPTVTDVGDLVHTSWLPPTSTGTGLSADGLVGDGPGEEWILKPSTKYLLRITNNSGATIDYRYEFLWYEPDYEA